MINKTSKSLYPIIFLILAIIYTLPFLMKLDYLGGRDWDLFTTIAAVPAGSILEYSQFPFWNPYLGGGNILFHHPEVLVLSPFLLLYLIFGAVIGLKLQVLISYFIGFYGTFKFLEKAGLSKPAAAMGAVIYFGSVHFALHFAEGHMPFTHFCFTPWFLFYLLKAKDTFKYIIPAAISLMLMILGNGAAVPFLYTMTFSALFFLLLSIQQKQIVYIRNFSIAAISGVLLAAVKFIPMAIYLLQNKWEGNPDESIPLSALSSIFFGFKHSLYVKNFPEQFWNWHEYGAYISPVIVILIVYLLLRQFKKHYLWLILLIFFFLLGLGNFNSFSPWSILSNLPGYSSIRCSGRSFQFVLLAVAVLGGFGYDLLREKIKHIQGLKLISPLILTIVIGTNLFFAVSIMAEAFKEKKPDIYRSPIFKHVIDASPRAFKNYLANRGSLVTPWLSAYHPSRGLVDDQNLVVEEYILSGKADIVKREYTPNQIRYSLTGTEAGEIVFGMGYDPGWQRSPEAELYSTNSLITTRFEKGENNIELTYQTPYFHFSLLLSLIASFAAAWIWRKY